MESVSFLSAFTTTRLYRTPFGVSITKAAKMKGRLREKRKITELRGRRGREASEMFSILTREK